MGFIQSTIGGYAKASEYDAKKNAARIKGISAKNVAYAKATASEQASKKQLHQVGDNMARAAGNKRREMAGARAASAASGFAPGGSAAKQEELVARAYDVAMSDMARSGSVASMNALNEQIALRRGGDAALRAANVEARQYRALASQTRTGAFMGAVGGAIGAIGGAAGAAAGGGGWAQIAGSAIQGANSGSDVMNAFNPFMSDFVEENWQDRYLSMLGVGQKKK